MKYTVSNEDELKKILNITEHFPESFKQQISLIENTKSIIHISLGSRDFDDLPKYIIPENPYEIYFFENYIKLEFNGIIITIPNKNNKFKLTTIKDFRI